MVLMNATMIKKKKVDVLCTVFSAGVNYSKSCIALIKSR